MIGTRRGARGMMGDRMKSGTLAAVTAVLLLHAGGLCDPAAAQGQARTDTPAGERPDDPAKFFLFHMTDVTYEQARADYVFCIQQARPILSLRDKMGNSGGGLLGAMIGARMAEIDRLRMRNAAMRQCMGLIGYARYLVPEPEWKALVNEGDIVVADNGQPDPVVVERLARFASGPAPTTQRLDP
jgi:hypothetical protein